MNHQRKNSYAKAMRPKGESQSSGEAKKAASTTQQRAPSSAGQWKSTFQPTDEAAPQDCASQDTSTSNPQRVELYDPYTQLSAESEAEVGQGAERRHHHSPQNDVELWRRWEMGRSQPEETHGGGGGERRDRSGEWQDRSAERRGRSPERRDRSGEWQDRSPERRDRSGEWQDRGAERRDRSPERRDRSAAWQEQNPESCEWREQSGEWQDRSTERRDQRAERHLSPSGSHQHPHQPHQASSPGVQRNYDQLWPARPMERSSSERHSLGEERVLGPPMNTEFATNVGLSTANLPADYQLQTGYSETGATPTVNTNTAPPREVAGSSRGFTTVDMEKRSTFSCELCEVKYARLEALQEHLESRSHWDMMEHIQVLNNYDDLTIAFLQEVMMFKVRRGCHAMVEQDIEALKETDYLSRVDMLHCSVCNVYISTYATSVKSHVDSVKHHDNKQSFCYRQKRQCLEKAAVMMDLLKPQFQQYREGGNPFE